MFCSSTLYRNHTSQERKRRHYIILLTFLSWKELSELLVLTRQFIICGSVYLGYVTRKHFNAVTHLRKTWRVCSFILLLHRLLEFSILLVLLL